MRRVSVEHYENFPVASVLCPPALRPCITAIYHFARTADDIADEGDDPPATRRATLQAYRRDLEAVAAGGSPGSRWHQTFGALRVQMQRHKLPPALLHDLLDAFEQDVDHPVYADRAGLLGYCRLSANPVGRLLLHLYGIDEPAALRQSDAICTALQLINFWQDLSVDGPRGRCYVSVEDARAHGVTPDELRRCTDSGPARALVRSLGDWSEGLMREGAPLALRVPGRAGWELRLVVQGGLRILEKIRGMDHAALLRRPRLTPLDLPLIAWRALRMGRTAA
jgi:squalene synthase HpnC